MVPAKSPVESNPVDMANGMTPEGRAGKDESNLAVRSFSPRARSEQRFPLHQAGVSYTSVSHDAGRQGSAPTFFACCSSGACQKPEQYNLVRVKYLFVFCNDLT